MPPSVNTQTIVAFIWDFDKTLTTGYMQDPLFDEYEVDAREFWKEVNGLVDYYRARGMEVSKDTAYLGHILSYVRDGHFHGLTNAKLRELGALVPLAPGMPGFMERTQKAVEANERFAHHGIKVEHFIVSTGLKQMIEGNPIREHVADVWACELLSASPGRGYLADTATIGPMPASDEPLSAIGYTIDNTTKTRAVFEINKGTNFERTIDVNALVPHDERRVPFENMIYIADGPSDVPVFSVINQYGGKTLGVYTGSAGARGNYAEVRQLQDEGRVNHAARANYEPDSEADMWLMHSLEQIANEICNRRERAVGSIAAPPGHIV